MEIQTLTLRPIQTADNPAMAAIVRKVMTAYGAIGEGFSINDPEVDDLHGNYQAANALYLVLEKDGQVLGGGGIAPLANGDPQVCELKKMYFLPEARGMGMGQKLVGELLAAARERGYQTCYLETLERMTEAQSLYQKMGFRKLCGKMGDTGHGGCDSFYAIDLA
jgi:putative acetyltransferase